MVSEVDWVSCEKSKINPFLVHTGGAIYSVFYNKKLDFKKKIFEGIN